MGVIIAVIIVVIVLASVFYIHTVSKLGRLHESARNAAGELDTLLWDRNHILGQVIKILEENEISVPDECKTDLGLGLGMLPALQMSIYTTINRRGNIIFSIVKEHPELAESEKIKHLMGRFTKLKIDIADSGSRYNQRATAFNAYIQTPLARFLASRKNMREKGHFNIAVAEVTT